MSLLKHWPNFGQHPYFIAGPCSAETEEQVHQTVSAIRRHCPEVNVLRAGIWKPRTSPDAFQGVGAVGITWLKDAAEEAGLPTTIEVASAEHVEEALLNEIDILWIGARTTVNPFGVQEIAEALKGVDIPVMVKNPINPDLSLWIGAFERLERCGLKQLAAIHRGFSSYEKSIYRNRPSWELPIELRRRLPELPIICDPSHICGRRDLLASVAQTAMDMSFDGLMLESHIQPDKAWSDAAQQLTPENLHELFVSLLIRQTKQPLTDKAGSLDDLRAKIDRMDDYIIELLGERMKIAEEIGLLKKDRNIAIHQSERWSSTMKRAMEIGKANGLSEEFILQLFQQIHNESILHQKQVMDPYSGY